MRNGRFCNLLNISMMEECQNVDETWNYFYTQKRFEMIANFTLSLIYRWASCLPWQLIKLPQQNSHKQHK